MGFYVYSLTFMPKKYDRKAIMERLRHDGLMGEYNSMIAEYIEKGRTPKMSKWYTDRHFGIRFKLILPPTYDNDLPDWVRLKKKYYENKPKISFKQAVDWALNHVSYRDIKPKDAPSAVAWLYLEKMRSDGGFLKDVLKQRVPRQTETQKSEGMNDDGRKLNELIDKLEAEAKESSRDTVLQVRSEKVAV